ncbi:TOM1-like protein 2 [Linum perenne]
MDKLKLAEWGERLRTGGAQMSRVVSDKMKEILQAPTPESKMVDDAAAETLVEPNWGLNLRICALINSDEFNCADVVRAIKKKISGKSEVGQRLSLDLLEACTMNCEKVFSAVASEKALDEMMKLIDNPLSDPENRNRAMQLIAAWGESEDLEYLPVFRQTYMVLFLNLKQRSVLHEGNVAPVENSLESYFQPMPPPGSFPVPDSGLRGMGHGIFPQNFLSAEEKNEVLVTSRNSLELLSSILNADTEPKPIKVRSCFYLELVIFRFMIELHLSTLRDIFYSFLLVYSCPFRLNERWFHCFNYKRSNLGAGGSNSELVREVQAVAASCAAAYREHHR